jgi:arylsulfatase A-like enzyme
MNRRRINRRTFLGTAGGAVAAGALGAVPQRVFAQTEKGAGKWVIFVTIDTQRADHCSSYGYVRTTTPFLDSLAKTGARFTKCHSNCSSTLPSHTCMMTGLELPQHGVWANRSEGCPDSVRTAAQMFKEAGYATGGFVSTPFLRKVNAGFDTFDNDFIRDRRYRWAENTIEQAHAWLSDRRADENVFLWLHVFDPHEWMSDSEPQSKMPAMASTKEEDERLFSYWTEDQKKLIDTGKSPLNGRQDVFIEKMHNYDSKTWYTDHALRRLYTLAEEKGPKSDTTWIVTADHGEGLGNHGYDQHSQYVYEPEIHVPLFVHCSNGDHAGTVHDKVVGHADFFPTFAEMLGHKDLQQVAPYEGLSLFAQMRGEAPAEPRYVFSHRQIKHPDYKAAQKWIDDYVYTLVGDRYKYIRNESGEDEMFDLQEDPHELNNLHGKEHPEEGTLYAMANERVDRLRDTGIKLGTSDVAPSSLSAEEEEQLQAVGYL